MRTDIRSRLFFRALRFDYRNIWFGLGRSIIALATLSELVFSRREELFHPVAGIPGPHCQLMHSISLFCFGGPTEYVESRQIFAVLVLSIAASGWKPRYVALPHLWVTFSISTSVTLPDGGDSIALIVLILITPLCLLDNRTLHWNRPTRLLPAESRAIGFVFTWALRAQVSYIYLDSAISKMGVTEWADGSAFYYFVRDKMFGSAGWFGVFWWWISSTSIGCIALTWGTLILELLIGAWSLFGKEWRKMALWATVLLHTAIFAAIGLFSFSMIMIGACVLVANPDTAERLSRLFVQADNRSQKLGI